jgi:hypothetical protein
MHRSKLSTFVIDCKTDDLSAAAHFWSAALKRELSPPQPGDERYRELVCAPGEPLLMIQRVGHDSRVHLDIESDDIEAEVTRLVALGARAVERVHTWVVMESPTGHRFCVVRPQRPAHTPPPFEPAPEHKSLGRLSGHYDGKTRTYLEGADGPPDESDDTLYAEPALGGRWLKLFWYGNVTGKPRQGELSFGFHRDAGEYELTWIDTFHTGTSMLVSRGKPSDDGVLRVLGDYAAGGERWGWRTEIEHIGRRFTLRCFNIAPSGSEEIALESTFVPHHNGSHEL